MLFSAALVALLPLLASARMMPRSVKHSRHARSVLATRDDSKIYTGLAFWGSQNGQTGACGETHDDEFLLAGISSLSYKQDLCGKYIMLLNGANNKTVVAKVTDSCDGGCTASGDVYLSPGAFEKLGPLSEGILRVAWTFVSGPEASKSADPITPSTRAAFVDKATPSPAPAEDSDCSTEEPEPKTTPAAEPVAKVAQPKPEAKVAAPKVEEAPAPKVEKKVEEKPAEPKVEKVVKVAQRPKASSSGGLELGLAWATDDRWAPLLLETGNLKWYFHWADPIVSQLSGAGLEFYPNLWNGSPDNIASFNAQIASVGTPKWIFGPNEPDIPSQANMSPQAAAALWKQHIEPHAGKSKLCAPAVAYDVEWVKSFAKACSGCTIDAVGLHSYDVFKGDGNIQGLKSRVLSMRAAFPDTPIIIGEFSLQAEGGPNQQQTINYMKAAIAWLKTQDYVLKASWFGAWSPAGNPDGFALNNGAFFNNGGTSLSEIGQVYVNL